MSLGSRILFTVNGGTAIYEVRTIDPHTAENFGCPDATHIRHGIHENVFGSLTLVTGKPVRVPGWSRDTKGLLARFTPWSGYDEPFDGYVETVDGFIREDAVEALGLGTDA